MCSILFFNFLNKIYNTYRDLHTLIILNNVLKITLDNASIPIDEIVFCHTHKQFHLSHVAVADPYSSDLSRLPERALQFNLIQYPQKFCSERLKKFSLQ